MDSWTPEEGERLNLILEPENIKDKYIVSVLKDGLIVAHVLYNLTPQISQFLKRDINKAFAEVGSKPINRGTGLQHIINICCCLRLQSKQISELSQKPFLRI